MIKHDAAATQHTQSPRGTLHVNSMSQHHRGLSQDEMHPVRHHCNYTSILHRFQYPVSRSMQTRSGKHGRDFCAGVENSVEI